jgi:dolichol-phosphate mannosyltransferase
LEPPIQRGLFRPEALPLSIVIPTYNEAENISRLLEGVTNALSSQVTVEILVVDDNSPDGTADLVETYSKSTNLPNVQIRVIKRAAKLGLSSAILAGMQSAAGEIIVVMDSDLSHPPETIPAMLEELRDPKYDIIVASRYIKGGSTIGWPLRRKLMSRSATKIAKYSLGVAIEDPMSGFFAVRRNVIRDVKFEPIGFKMLLEMVVKARGANIKEIPYSFINRKLGSSKVDRKVAVDYLRSVWHLYRYDKSASEEKRPSVRFFSKAGRFYTVGASGLLLNYAVSALIRYLMPDLWFIYATIIGIVFSIVSNFILNKIWTFNDRDFGGKKFAIQIGMFFGFSSLGALVQLGLLYVFVQIYSLSYETSLVAAVALASVTNFLFNKKWTFHEKVWS